MNGESFRGVSMFASLFQKNGFAFVEQILHFLTYYQYSITQKIRFRVLADFRTSLQKTPTWRENI